MARLRGPRWDSNYERWRKILLSWLRLQDKDKTNDEIVAAVILGLNESSTLPTGDSVIDIILGLGEEELYPPQLPALENDVPDEEKNFQLS